MYLLTHCGMKDMRRGRGAAELITSVIVLSSPDVFFPTPRHFSSFLPESPAGARTGEMRSWGTSLGEMQGPREMLLCTTDASDPFPLWIVGWFLLQPFLRPYWSP